MRNIYSSIVICCCSGAHPKRGLFGEDDTLLMRDVTGGFGGRINVKRTPELQMQNQRIDKANRDA